MNVVLLVWTASFINTINPFGRLTLLNLSLHSPG